MATGNTDLQVIDVSDPANPSVAASCDTIYANDVTIAGNYAYVAAVSDGLKVVDISNPISPTLVGSCDTPHLAYGVNVSGSYAYVADQNTLQIIDISNPTTPSLIGSCNTSDFISEIYVSGNHVYAAIGYSGLQIMNEFTPLTNVAWASDTEITATVPAGFAAGTYNLHVINPGNRQVLIPNKTDEDFLIIWMIPGICQIVRPNQSMIGSGS